ncbi:hypothetical protein AAVH_33339 [Aphelenchoides avenae]|nr:hypothetical protein AAVH_33339 [Aphelenchus avenae]
MMLDTFFVNRFPRGGAQTRQPRTVDVCDIWREPLWPTTIDELISAADEGIFDMMTNNCLCATQRMVRRMGRLEELHQSFENGICIPEDDKRKLRPYKFK